MRVWMFVLLAAALLVGCGSDDAADEPAEPAPPALDRDLDAKPELAAVLAEDRGDPPGELVVEELVEGDGAAAEEGDVLTVHFVGALWASGAEFDATWDRSQPYTFELGAGRVIEGWDVGLVGMREGGRRLLVVPPQWGYDDRGAAGVIGPGETLVFVVDLLDVEAG